MNLDDIVSVSITKTESTRLVFGTPVIVSAKMYQGGKVRIYRHWTQIFLQFGTEKMRTKAKRWLKRKGLMKRRKRRGW